MRLKCVMDTFIICISSVWSERRIFFVHVWWWRWHLLLGQLVFANWTNHVHWVVECSVIESLAILCLTREWIERCLLQLRLMVCQFLAKDLFLDVVVRWNILVTILFWIIKEWSTLSSLTMQNAFLHGIGEEVSRLSFNAIFSLTALLR